jgi:glycosyltransferase involved in cell wall biosynthesis
MPGGVFGLTSQVKMKINGKLTGCKVTKDTTLGYPVWRRTWCPWEIVEYVAGKEKPDLIVVLAINVVRMALAAMRTGIPVILKLQDVEFQNHDGDFNELGDIPCVANSEFTAKKYQHAYGVRPTVICPYIQTENYKTETTKETVAFINPYPQKGRDIALNVARLNPDILFTFVEGWPLTTELRRELMQRLASLPNVTLLAAQRDMRNVYSRCKILLAPSVWEEAYGMVVTEAQISGIPVIASNRGGLPETVGPGGLTLDPDGPIEDWSDAIRRLWHDGPDYAKFSAAARSHANRPELAQEFQIDAYERLFLAASRGQR